MSEVPAQTDQQQRDAHLVRQTEALESIASHTRSMREFAMWGFWLGMAAVVLLFVLVFGLTS